jgi:hypothetical protein
VAFSRAPQRARVLPQKSCRKPPEVRVAFRDASISSESAFELDIVDVFDGGHAFVEETEQRGGASEAREVSIVRRKLNGEAQCR